MELAQNRIALAHDRHINQWYRINIPEKKPHLYRQLIYDKEGKNTQWGKDSLFLNGVGKTGELHAKKNQTLTPCTKRNSKWIKDLNVWPETIKTSQRKYKQ